MAGSSPLMISAAQQAALARSGWLDAPRDARHELVCQLARELLDAPTALLSIVTDDQNVFKGAAGLAEPWASRGAVPVASSICRYVVASGEPLVSEDVRVDPRLRARVPLVDLEVVAYLGVPVRAEGLVIACLCTIDARPRVWRQQDVALLDELAHGLT